MGMNCPSGFSRTNKSLAVVNMVVVGFKYSVKSSILSKLSKSNEETSFLDNSLGKGSLDIDSFILENKIKVVAFEVCSSMTKTWKKYYQNGHILLFVVDSL